MRREDARKMLPSARGKFMELDAALDAETQDVFIGDQLTPKARIIGKKREAAKQTLKAIEHAAKSNEPLTDAEQWSLGCCDSQKEYDFVVRSIKLARFGEYPIDFHQWTLAWTAFCASEAAEKGLANLRKWAVEGTYARPIKRREPGEDG